MPCRTILGAALGLLLSAPTIVQADTPIDPFLPSCTHAGPGLTPIPRWEQTFQEIPRFLSTPGSDTERIVYISYAVDSADVSTEEANGAYSLFVDIAHAANEAPRLKVIFRGEPQFAIGDFIFSGFYALDRKSATRTQVRLRQLDTFDIVSSRRYCLAEASVAPPAASARLPRPKAAARPLEPCRGAQDNRIPIAMWEPQVDNECNIRHLPPIGEGRIVYISIDPPTACRTQNPQDLFVVKRPNDVNRRSAGGVAVNLRGNYKLHDGKSRFQGFYMNEPVFGIRQGWTETYFRAIEKSRIEATGQYCLAPRNHPHGEEDVLHAKPI